MEAYLRVQLLVMPSGERHSILLDAVSGSFVYAPNLFLTTQVRNASLSHASVSAYAGCLCVLYRFCSLRNIDLQSRFLAKKFLCDAELDALKDYCRLNFNASLTSDLGTKGAVKRLITNSRWVAKGTLHRRLTVITKYLAWFSRQLFTHLDEEPVGLTEMISTLRARRPTSKGRNNGLIDRSLNEEQVSCLLQAIEVASSNNPFDGVVRARNRLIVLLQYELGARAGEILNIRIEDFDFANNTLRIVRRADQPDDPRAYQPLVKTCDRELPLSDWLIAEVHRYILDNRLKVVGAKKCPYLFVTYKAGPTQGNPLSITAYNKMWIKLQKMDPLLVGVTGHRLRHTWNNRFSKKVDEGLFDLTEAQEEAARSTLMGWKQGSGSAKLYNQRHVTEKAHAASVHLQQLSQLKEQIR